MIYLHYKPNIKMYPCHAVSVTSSFEGYHEDNCCYLLGLKMLAGKMYLRRNSKLVQT